MRVTIRGLRAVITAALALPVVPLAYYAATGIPGQSASGACATGATCLDCVTDTCWKYSTQAREYDGKTTVQRCLDSDAEYPRNCGYVEARAYRIMGWSNATSSYYTMARCTYENCGGGVENDEECPEPFEIF